MFNIIRFTHDATTGIVELELKFDTGNGTKPDIQSFPDVDIAISYLSSCKRDYLLLKITKYLEHKIHIAANSQLSFYHTEGREKSIDVIRHFVPWAFINDIEEVCKYALRLQPDLENILPIAGNPSFASSCNELKSILDFAKQNLITSKNIIS